MPNLRINKCWAAQPLSDEHCRTSTWNGSSSYCFSSKRYINLEGFSHLSLRCVLQSPRDLSHSAGFIVFKFCKQVWCAEVTWIKNLASSERCSECSGPGTAHTGGKQCVQRAFSSLSSSFTQSALSTVGLSWNSSHTVRRFHYLRHSFRILGIFKIKLAVTELSN